MSGGIIVDSFVKMEAGCPVTVDIVGEQVQFRFGGERSSGLTLVFSEPGLAQLAAVCAGALESMRSASGSDRSMPKPAGRAEPVAPS
ncbi:MAG TPA: hypothetical protein VGX25_07535 [Actinophytocola sp.]|uniref:hypothetical protein n=1 Tax=Actinophytocola sp. TaxID=1872138 RepID=UPI002DDCC814|nr:hypothetical protein [Actinophytocola sp.]HEV2779238.1 hypothetical protein [Actinophytocola sp.]